MFVLSIITKVRGVSFQAILIFPASVERLFLEFVGDKIFSRFSELICSSPCSWFRGENNATNFSHPGPTKVFNKKSIQIVAADTRQLFQEIKISAADGHRKNRF